MSWVSDAVFTPGALATAKPDEQSVSEASGNAGASFERSYRIAALVLWPLAQLMDVPAQSGTRATLPALQARIRGWMTASNAEQPVPVPAPWHWPRRSSDSADRDFEGYNVYTDVTIPRIPAVGQEP